MTNHNHEVLRRIKATFKNEVAEYRNIRVPGEMGFEIVGNNMCLFITANAVCQNMQSDKASFEGWALVLKRWGKFTKIILRWDKPSFQYGSPEEGHYQRFLFRVSCFREHFNVWFSIDSSCASEMKVLKTNGQGPYFLNKPGSRRDEDIPQTKEGLLEYKFAKGEFKQTLMSFTNAIHIERQLPVGVFEGEVSSKTAIFSRGKSAIDIWGLNQNNELLIFELKGEQNDKVGIISEIYFYSNVLMMVLRNKWTYEKPCERILESVCKTRRIKAYILAPSVHPLIDKNLIDEINRSTMPEIETHFIKFDLNSSTLLNQLF